jgi:putative ABC transport system permease protein
MEALRENSRSATATAAKQRLRSVFVVVQVSLALVLLIGAGLLMKSFLNLHSLPVGFDYSNMTTFLIQFPQGGGFLRETGQTTATGSMEIEFNQRISLVSEQIRERLAGIPGVQGATAIGVTPPLSGGARAYAFTIDGAPPVANPAERPSAQWFPVMSEYFQTLEMSATRGRLFTARDTIAGPPVVVISQTAASKFFPNEDPIGKRIQIDFFNDQPREIVGVVADIRQNMQAQEPAAQMYVPYAQLPQIQAALTALGAQYVTFIVRSTGDLGQITEAMRSAVAEADPTQAISHMRTMEEVVGLQLLVPWIYSTLLTIFGSVAVLLSVVGIYGIMAHSVNQRTGEIGVRMALGASAGDILKLILKRGVILIGIGVVIGIPIAFAITRVVRSVLYGVSATDPMTFIVALVALSAAGFLACYIPARRALRIDPIIALRNE